MPESYSLFPYIPFVAREITCNTTLLAIPDCIAVCDANNLNLFVEEW